VIVDAFLAVEAQFIQVQRQFSNIVADAA
jgi:hypothetical protein